MTIIRGATTIERDEREEIVSSVKQMLDEIFHVNALKKEEIKGFYIVNEMREITPTDITDEGVETISWTSFVFAHKLEKRTTILSSFDTEEIGDPGDYVVCRVNIADGKVLPDDNIGYCILPKELLEKNYEEYKNLVDNMWTGMIPVITVR